MDGRGAKARTLVPKRVQTEVKKVNFGGKLSKTPHFSKIGLDLTGLVLLGHRLTSEY